MRLTIFNISSSIIWFFTYQFTGCLERKINEILLFFSRLAFINKINGCNRFQSVVLSAGTLYPSPLFYSVLYILRCPKTVLDWMLINILTHIFFKITWVFVLECHWLEVKRLSTNVMITQFSITGKLDFKCCARFILPADGGCIEDKFRSFLLCFCCTFFLLYFLVSQICFRFAADTFSAIWVYFPDVRLNWGDENLFIYNRRMVKKKYLTNNVFLVQWYLFMIKII